MSNMDMAYPTYGKPMAKVLEILCHTWMTTTHTRWRKYGIMDNYSSKKITPYIIY
jgi:hypothetical protein